MCYQELSKIAQSGHSPPVKPTATAETVIDGQKSSEHGTRTSQKLKFGRLWTKNVLVAAVVTHWYMSTHPQSITYHLSRHSKEKFLPNNDAKRVQVKLSGGISILGNGMPSRNVCIGLKLRGQQPDWQIKMSFCKFRQVHSAHATKSCRDTNAFNRWRCSTRWFSDPIELVVHSNLGELRMTGTILKQLFSSSIIWMDGWST